MRAQDSLSTLAFTVLASTGALLGCDAKDVKPSDAATDKLVGFQSAQQCASCHPQHAAEWSISPHAYAMKDPVFLAMVRLGQEQTEGELGNFCVRCHSPIADDTGQAEVFFDDAAGVFRQDLEAVDAIAAEGLNCDGCHSMTSVHTVANAGFTLEPNGTRRATIRDPVATAAHDSTYSELHADADMCGSCHQVVSQFFTKDVVLEATFREWQVGPFNGQQTCQDCHMETYRGQAGPGGPERTLHRHTFVGVDVSLLPREEFPGYDPMRELAAELLQRSAELGVRKVADAPTLEVSILNLAGHSLPSGATVDRQMWVEMIVRDNAGNVVFESGTLDENGDLRDEHSEHTTRPGSDPQLTVYRQTMYFDPQLEDPSSKEPRRMVEFLWQPNAEESHLIRNVETVHPRYDLSALPPGNYEASVRLLFRTFPPYLLRELEHKAGLSPDVKTRLPIVEMETATLAFTL